MVESWEVGWRRHWCPRRTTSLCDWALSSPIVLQWSRSPGSPGVERWDSPGWTNFCVCCVHFVSIKNSCKNLDNRMRHQEVHLQHLRFVNKHSNHVLTWPSNIIFITFVLGFGQTQTWQYLSLWFPRDPAQCHLLPSFSDLTTSLLTLLLFLLSSFSSCPSQCLCSWICHFEFGPHSLCQTCG